jgi:hypothetical protein
MIKAIVILTVLLVLGGLTDPLLSLGILTGILLGVAITLGVIAQVFRDTEVKFRAEDGIRWISIQGRLNLPPTYAKNNREVSQSAQAQPPSGG